MAGTGRPVGVIIIQTNNFIITREAGLTSREPSISYDVYDKILAMKYTPRLNLW